MPLNLGTSGINFFQVCYLRIVTCLMRAPKKKPSFLMFGIDCRTPPEAVFLPNHSINPTDVDDYREELILSLSSARALAATHIQSAQRKYKGYYDRKAQTRPYSVGDWILVYFPSEEIGPNRKLSRPWHGPYHILSIHTPNVTAVKVYYPQDSPIRVYLSRIQKCPNGIPAGFYWYGGKKSSFIQTPKWLDAILRDSNSSKTEQSPRYNLRSAADEQTTSARDELPGKGE